MKLPRPYIPLSVRIVVAGRQLREHNWVIWEALFLTIPIGGKRLAAYLAALRGELKCSALQLDHEPALALRHRNLINGEVIGYIPDANDPDYLIYRATDSHRTKTFLRGEHGQRSDVAQITRERRRLKPRRAKRKIRSRGFLKISRLFPKRTPVRASRDRT